MSEPATERPIRLVVTDDLERSRLTVLFRIILLIPAWIAFLFWSVAAAFVAIAAWFVLLFRSRCSDGIHEFLSSYVRYAAQVSAYMYLAANPYPGFAPKSDYPVRVEIDPPSSQRRWTVLLRIFLAFPAFILATTVGGGLSLPTSRADLYWIGIGGAGAVSAAAFLGWFASLARGRMPNGLRDLAAYSIGYTAQTWSYLLLLTDRYPSSDPRLAGPMALPDHPVSLELTDQLARPRLLVFFRILLALPHLVWLVLWSVLAFLAAILGWLIAPFPARLPRFLHRFLAAYVRYATHVGAFLYVIGGPFPGFVGAYGSYPVDIAIAPPARQGRWGLVFRGFLGIPAFLLAIGYSGIVFVVGILAWWSALFRGRVPEGLRNLGAVALRYEAQTYAYLLLLTATYPYSSPALEDGTQHIEPDVLELPLPGVESPDEPEAA
jgi:hypothetical protein